MADIRLDRLNKRLFERVVETGSLVLKTIGGKRKDEVAASRFLANGTINPAIILAPHIERTKTAVAGCSIPVVQDTTEINFSGRAARRKCLGPACDGVSSGFFIHQQVASPWSVIVRATSTPCSRESQKTRIFWCARRRIARSKMERR